MTAPDDRYSKVARRIWRDGWFVGLAQDEQIVWFYLLTSPFLGAAPGLLPIGAGQIADETGIKRRRIDAILTRFRDAGKIRISIRPPLIWLPKAAEYNQPESPNVAHSWASSLRALPECEIRDEAVSCFQTAIVSQAAAAAFAEVMGRPSGKPSPKASGKPSPKASGKPSHKASAKTCPNQEQEQQQEQEEQSPSDSSPADGRDEAVIEAQEVKSALAEVWQVYREEQATVGVERQATPTKALRAALLARIAEHGSEAVCDVIRWAHRSKHDRAVYLREHGHLGETLFRPGKCADYLALSKAKEQHSKGTPDNGADAEAWAEIKRRNDEKQAELVKTYYRKD